MINLTADIQYQDDFFSKDFAEHLSDKIKTFQKFEMSGSSIDGDNPSFWYMNLSDDLDFREELKYIQGIIPNRIIRSYVNGQTFGQFGDFHSDDGEETYLYYLDKDWNIDDGGATEFRMANDTTVCVYPKFNRMCKFDSAIFHRSMPNRNFKKLRMTLAFKTERN
jgi:hypothetical protein